MSDRQFCYAITIGDKTKIGMSKNPTRRIRGILMQAGAAEQEAETTIIKVKNMKACESASHDELASLRGVGEWFYVSHSVAVNVITSNNDVGDDILPDPSMNMAEVESYMKGMFKRQYRIDTETAIHELSKPGGVDEAIAEVLVAAAYCDSDLYRKPMIERCASIGETMILESTFSFLTGISLSLRCSGMKVMDRLSVLCRTNTDEIVMETNARIKLLGGAS